MMRQPLIENAVAVEPTQEFFAPPEGRERVHA